MLPPPPTGFSNPRHRAEVIHHFASVGFDGQAVARLTQHYQRDVLEPRARSLMLRATDSFEPRAVLLRLFILGEPVPPIAAEAGLGSVPVTAWLDAGYLEQMSDGTMRAPITIWPLAGIWVAADRDPRESGDPSVVMGVSGSTETLARIAVRGSDIARAADIGTGSGILALILSRYATSVIATDLEPRSIAFAEVNARLNDIGNVQFRVGDGVEPIAHDQFDRILCNPPFVLSPKRRFTYRDGGPGFIQKLLRDLPGVLAPGRFAQLLAQWPIRAGETPHEILRWFETAPTDVEVLLGRIHPAEAYATRWVGSPSQSEEPGADELALWLDRFQELGIQQVAEGLVTLRTPQVVGPAHRALEPVPPRMDDKTALELERRFLRNDFQRRHAGDELLLAHLRVSPGVRIMQETEARNDGWSAPRLRLSVTTGLVRDREIDSSILALVTTFDGARSLAAVFGELSIDASTTPDEDSPTWLEIARALLSEGFLEFAE
mgnify:FL=1